MDQKIAALTEKIYQEGVAKGEEQAREITGKAKTEAERIVADAKKEADKIVHDAQEQAQEMKRNAESEIKLAGQQATSSIKQQIMDLLSGVVVEQNVSAALDSPETIKEFIAAIVQNWKVSEGEAPSVEVLLPEAKREQLEQALKGGMQKVLKSGPEITFTRNIKGGFQIGPKDGTFKISLTDQDFSEFFKEFLRPKMRSYLFAE
jgi:V/A-type H+-transporting ATPase subunit E